MSKFAEAVAAEEAKKKQRIEQERLVAQLLADNDRRWQEIEDKKFAQTATTTIVKNAVVGGIVAGPAGAVVGAIVGKTKVDTNNR